MDGSLPVYAISHGGGPWPWIKDQGSIDWTPLEAALAAIPDEVGTSPSAVLMISAHWETATFRVQANPRPPMLYDYGGFPEFTYSIQYPAPGDPELADRVVELLRAADIDAGVDPARGFDHGMFAPMKVICPDADMPVVQLSILQGYDPAAHLAAGRALAPLRDEGVLIVGSGFPSFHDLSALQTPTARRASAEFDAWLTETMTAVDADERTARLLRWESAPSARVCHPREDHFIPLLMAVGAAHGEPGKRHYHEPAAMGTIASSGYRLG